MMGNSYLCANHRRKLKFLVLFWYIIVENIDGSKFVDGNTHFNWRYMVVERLSVLGSVLLLVFMGISFSGCLDDGEDEAGVDCAEVFCIGTLLAEGEGFNAPLIEAVDLAKDDINKAGGNIEIISGNSFRAGAEAGEAVASAMQLYEMGVRGIVGPSYSSDSEEVFPFWSKMNWSVFHPRPLLLPLPI